MANEIRIRGNLTSGTLSVALAAGDTTMSSAGLASLPAVTSAGHAVILIENELVYVTAHTAAATTATILRGQEGTTAATHALNVAWFHGPVVSDYDSVLGYAQATTSQTAIGTTATDVTGVTTTVTVPYAQHRVKVTANVHVQIAATAAIATGAILDGATQVGGAFAVLSASGFSTLRAEAVVVPAVGNHTYKLQLSGNAGTINTGASATTPAFILVEDLGPAL